MQEIKNQNPITPFACKYTPQIPELLLKLNCSIVISTYQAGKLIFLSPKDENNLIQLPRTFNKPMGVAYDQLNGKLAVACKDEVIQFSNSKDLATHYPKSPGKYDSLFLPRQTFHTNDLDIHDLRFGTNGELFAVNTLFSCIVKIDAEFNFTPFWNPPFIDSIVSEDRCHLNGMVMQNGKPKYATAFNRGNSIQSWRENKTKTGIVIDIDTNEIICEGLPMPHSPLLYKNELYVLLSATGELVKIDPAEKNYKVICKPGGFVRGMAVHKDYIFIGTSKLRKNSSAFSDLPVTNEQNEAGISIFYLPTGSLVGKITYLSSVDEIYDVMILPDFIRPNILNTINDEYKSAVMMPGKTFWAKPKD